MTEDEKKQRKKEAQRKYTQKYQAKLKEKYNEYVALYPERIKEAKAKYRRNNRESLQQYILDNYEWYIWNSCKNRCRKLGLPFNLRVEDIKIPTHCPYLGMALTRIRYRGRQDYNPSLDRIDPNKGYVKENVEVISDKANRMKNNASCEELITFAEAVLRRFGRTTHAK